MFSEGSAKNDIKNASIGTYTSTFSISCPIGKYCDNFDGEIEAILLLINLKYNENANVHSYRIKLFELKNSRESIALQWIRSHCDFLVISR